LGGSDDLKAVLDTIVADNISRDGRQARLLEALIHASTGRKVRPRGDLGGLAALLDARDEPIRAAALRAAGVWQVELLRLKVLETARAATTSEVIDRAALEALSRYAGPSSRDLLDDLSRTRSSPRARARAVIALAAVDSKLAAARTVDLLEASSVEPSDLEGVVAALLNRRDGPGALTTALSSRRLLADRAKVAARTVAASGRPEPALVEALAKAGGLANKQAPPSGALREAILSDLLRQGDPARGEAIFRRKELTCLNCHAIAGAGGQVGPGLESIGASAPVDYLLDSLFEPNKAVKEGYHSLVIATDDGRTITGIKLRQTDKELVLRDAEDREVVVPLASIEDQKQGGSLMPNGLVDSLSRSQLVDLLQFLSELGKVGVYSVGKARLVRRWEVLQSNGEDLSTLSEPGLGAVASAGSRFHWAPAYSKVSGLLPVVELPGFPLGPERSQRAIVRFQLDVSTPGRIDLSLEPAEEVTAWLDGSPKPLTSLALDLPAGRHTITLAVPHDVLLRCELRDVAGSPAHIQPLLGK
jgi:putative heme-binding domain-containing protein